MWNYLFFKAYIHCKDQNEFNGNESIINDKINRFGKFLIKI